MGGKLVTTVILLIGIILVLISMGFYLAHLEFKDCAEAFEGGGVCGLPLPLTGEPYAGEEDATYDPAGAQLYFQQAANKALTSAMMYGFFGILAAIIAVRRFRAPAAPPV